MKKTLLPCQQMVEIHSNNRQPPESLLALVGNKNRTAIEHQITALQGLYRAAGVSNPTLSRRISALEKAVGLRLLHRTTRKVELTEAGVLYFERCKQIVNEARLAHEQLGDILVQPSGVLRASLPVDLAVSYLAPALVAFADHYPDIRFDLDLTPRHVDLVSEPFDIAIRVGEPEDSSLIARPVASLETALYASPGYLEAAGTPQHPEELKQHTCLGILKTTRWQLHGADSIIELPLKPGRFVLNSIGMLRKLATLDQGLVLMPDLMMADELAAGTVQRILPEWRGNPVPVYAVTETRLLPAKTQVFINFLRERLAETGAKPIKNWHDMPHFTRALVRPNQQEPSHEQR